LTPSRMEDRATIEGTIRITDQVVAEKDRQLAELEQQLRDLEAHRSTPNPSDEIAAAVDADEAIQAERQKLVALQEELDEKLRKAELELSVERAKIARERTRMEELEIELSRMRGNPTSKEGPDAGSAKGRGRWLSKLGL